MQIEFFPDIILKRPLDLPKKSEPECRFLMDDSDNYLFVFPEGEGFRLDLCHRDLGADETIDLGSRYVGSEAELEEILRNEFFSFVTEKEYNDLYEIAGGATYDAACMLMKQFPDQGDRIKDTAMAHLRESFGMLLREDYSFHWTKEMDALAPETHTEWSDDYKEVVANFYGVIYEEIYDAHCGVTTDRYDVIVRFAILGYRYDPESPGCVFRGPEDSLEFEDFGEAERWIDEQENGPWGRG